MAIQKFAWKAWKPPVNFATLHYAYIIAASIVSFIVIYPYGNIAAIDAYFFGASGCTESGLNTVDVKALKTYQQLVIYFIPIITQMGFINIIVVSVRLWWFEKRLKEVAPSMLRPEAPVGSKKGSDCEDGLGLPEKVVTKASRSVIPETRNKTAIKFADDSQPALTGSRALQVASPRDQDQGTSLTEVDRISRNYDDDDIQQERLRSLRDGDTCSMSKPNALSLDRVASSMFVIGSSENRRRSRGPSNSRGGSFAKSDLPTLSSRVTVGRNSQFFGLSQEDRERLGGIEYRALKLLLKICIGYLFGLHLFGAICLVGWIQYAPSQYTGYLESQGQNKIWWAFYSSQTMINNLGFTLTPDSMISFRDAPFPMVVMTFLAFAGHNFAPCFLRFVIWLLAKLSPKNSSIQKPLQFLLMYPRRCCTILFPSSTTWVLFTILVFLNTIDVIFMVALDLKNDTLTVLPLGPRILAAIFQAASARHTGTSTFNLSTINPAVQFSLLVMMYISVYPIAIATRASNTYEEQALGIFADEEAVNEEQGAGYLMMHFRNQLSFDLWYLFLGVFCICAAESDKIMDMTQPAYAVFPIFFEVTSAYGNVGLSLGHPDVNTSLVGQLGTFSKLVICAMMIRGRHRGLPYRVDRAILLPNDHNNEMDADVQRYHDHSQGNSHCLEDTPVLKDVAVSATENKKGTASED